MQPTGESQQILVLRGLGMQAPHESDRRRVFETSLTAVSGWLCLAPRQPLVWIPPPYTTLNSPFHHLVKHFNAGRFLSSQSPISISFLSFATFLFASPAGHGVHQRAGITKFPSRLETSMWLRGLNCFTGWKNKSRPALALLPCLSAFSTVPLL
jgi:hypothetical protein